MAASNDRIVSRGRSIRLRVGLERSGSARKVSKEILWRIAIEECLTDDVAVSVSMLYAAKGKLIASTWLSVYGH